ncbi:MAG TPA: DoxX family protein [Bryobacteraceae bacterium]|nr:DoxX family protein [Bryobacteraceae bacterium]
MKKSKAIYWTSTGFVALIMTISGMLAAAHTPRYLQALKHLGYPPYFANLLAVGKLAGVAVLLAPKLGKLNEWAYAGFAITVLSASYSHLSSGDGLLALDPLATFIALAISYASRPGGRRSELRGNLRNDERSPVLP